MRGSACAVPCVVAVLRTVLYGHCPASKPKLKNQETIGAEAPPVAALRWQKDSLVVYNKIHDTVRPQKDSLKKPYAWEFKGSDGFKVGSKVYGSSHKALVPRAGVVA
jgi:hypothetical protein